MHDASSPHHHLTHGGLTSEEAAWLAAGGADTWDTDRNQYPARALWMALGLLAYEGFKSLLYVSTYAAYCLLPTETTRLLSAFLYVFLCATVPALAYGIASGRLSHIVAALSRRYVSRRVFMRDLSIAALILIAIPSLVQLVALYIGGRAELSLGSLAAQILIAIFYRALPWCVCIRILAYVHPARKLSKATETPPAFDMEQAVIRWRAQLLACEGVREDDALELEEHLREETASCIRAGLSPHQAFAIACRRMGSTEELSSEFAKAQPALVWRTRAQWLLTGVLVTLLFLTLKQELLLLPSPLLFGNVAAAVVFPVADIIVWLAGLYLFMRFADGKFVRLTEWLGRRYTQTRHLATDFAFLSVVLLATDVFYMYAWNMGKLPLDQLLVLIVNGGLPLFVLAAAAMCWLRPRTRSGNGTCGDMPAA